MSTHDNIKYMDTLPLVQALWWAIENISPEGSPEEFFYLRERYRNEQQLEEVLADITYPNKGWAVAKSLQTQLDSATEALTWIVRYEKYGATSIVAKEALAKIEKHKES